MSITFSTCFYILKSKFDKDTYISWMNNLISIVNKFNLVIYTDQNSIQYINSHNNPNIKIIIKPLNQFYTYKYKDLWIKNHQNNSLLNNHIIWEVNMLWNEKISFVNETATNKYFNTPYYGWCDIGYFRNRSNDLNTSHLQHWAHKSKINNLSSSKIHYALINNNQNQLNYLNHIISNKNSLSLPSQPIPPDQISIAGGFFITHISQLDWWFNTFYNKLHLYLNNNYLVKDDQLIIIDCIFSNFDHFFLHQEHSKYDNWFMFQRILQ